mgnify:CR=1 FL=1|jgi:beta-galactosidase
MNSSGVHAILTPIPDGVEACRRVGNGKEAILLLNTTQQPQTVSLPTMMRDLFTGTTATTVQLPRYGVSVLAAQ